MDDYHNGKVPWQSGGNSSPYSETPPNTGYPKPNRFATASLILGLLSILTAVMGTFYPPFALGALAIILAVLSKGAGRKLAGYAKAGFITAIAGLTINIALLCSFLYLLFAVPSFSQAFHDQLNATSQVLYGMTFDEMLEQMQ